MKIGIEDDINSTLQGKVLDKRKATVEVKLLRDLKYIV